MYIVIDIYNNCGIEFCVLAIALRLSKKYHIQSGIVVGKLERDNAWYASSHPLCNMHIDINIHNNCGIEFCVLAIALRMSGRYHIQSGIIVGKLEGDNAWYASSHPLCNMHVDIDIQNNRGIEFRVCVLAIALCLSGGDPIQSGIIVGKLEGDNAWYASSHPLCNMHVDIDIQNNRGIEFRVCVLAIALCLSGGDPIQYGIIVGKLEGDNAWYASSHPLCNMHVDIDIQNNRGIEFRVCVFAIALCLSGGDPIQSGIIVGKFEGDNAWYAPSHPLCNMHSDIDIHNNRGIEFCVLAIALCLFGGYHIQSGIVVGKLEGDNA